MADAKPLTARQSLLDRAEPIRSRYVRIAGNRPASLWIAEEPLRARRERPSGCAAEQRDECAALDACHEDLFPTPRGGSPAPSA